MAKLFQTISLEDRLKDSPYNNINQEPKKVNQGKETSISKTFGNRLINYNTNIEIRPFGIFTHTSPTTINPFTILITQGQTTVGPFIYNPIQGQTTPQPYNITIQQGQTTVSPFINTPNQGSITILPYNADINQGSIQIGNFSFIPNQGQTTVAPFSYNPTQGQTTVGPFIFNPNQGQTTIARYVFAPIQGQTILGPYIFDPSQGQTTVGLFTFDPNHPAQTSPFTILPIPTPFQGQTTVGPFIFDPNHPNQTSPFTILPIPAPFQGQTTVGPFTFNPSQGIRPGPRPVSVTAIQPSNLYKITRADRSGTPLDPPSVRTTREVLKHLQQEQNWVAQGIKFANSPEQKHGSVILRLLQYEADRSLALFLPEVKHGSQIVDENYFPTDQRNKLGFVSNPSQEPLLTGFSLEKYYQVMDGLRQTPVGFVNKNNTWNLHPTNQSLLRNKVVDALKPGGENILPFESDKESEEGLGKNDLIKFIIKSERDGRAVAFKAFLTAFSENYTINWNDINYIGRQETLKAFKGVVRNASIGFKVVAFKETDMLPMYQRLEKLVQITAIGKVAGNYLNGPLCKITLGDWYDRVLCVFNSIKFDTQPTEYSWDVGSMGKDGEPGKESDGFFVPQIVDVNLELTILLTNGNKNLTSDGKYIDFATLDFSEPGGARAYKTEGLGVEDLNQSVIGLS